MTAFAAATVENAIPADCYASAKEEADQTVHCSSHLVEQLHADEANDDRDLESNSNDILSRNSPLPGIASKSVALVDHAATRKPEPGSSYTPLVEVVHGRLYFLPTADITVIQGYTRKGNYRFMTSNLHLMYEAFCDDFGPVAICQVIRFCRAMSKVDQAKDVARRKIVYYCESNPRRCANAVFLIVSYLVLELGWRVDDALRQFASLPPSMTEPFRDATWIHPVEHSLSVRKCVEGLLKAMKIGWLDQFKMAAYEKLDDPMFGNINRICPKFIAFKGPAAAADISKGDLATFPPHFYSHVFKKLGVDAVVRLNEASTYDPQSFRDAGLKHYDLFFEDCTVPSRELIADFLDICDKHRKVAVHCAAGLGRTGTLIAIWLIKHCGFGADDAIGFLRIMRPGCVIGPQQRFLQLVEKAAWDGNVLQRQLVRSQSAEVPPPVGGSQAPVRRSVSAVDAPSCISRTDSLFGGLMRVQQAEQMALQVREAMHRRAAKASCGSGGSFRGVPDGVTVTE